MQFVKHLGHSYNLAIMQVDDLKLLKGDIENDIANINTQLKETHGKWPHQRNIPWEQRAEHAFSVKRQQVRSIDFYIEKGGTGYEDLKFSQLFMKKAEEHLPSLLYKEVFEAAGKEHESVIREAILYKGKENGNPVAQEARPSKLPEK